MNLKQEINLLISEIKKLDKKLIIIFLTAPILLTISWYFTSRRFFILNLYSYFSDYEFIELAEFYYWFAGDFLVLFIIPILIIRFLIREKEISGYGICFGDIKAGFIISAIFFSIMIPFIWIATSFESFQHVYPMMSSSRNSWGMFFIYQAGLLLYIFAWEFIWRGYIQFGLRHRFGNYAIFIQTIPFVILHYGKPAIESFGAIAAGIALGILAFRTGSVFYGIIIHYSVMFSIDLVSVLRYRAGEYGAGLNSFLRLF
jgi:uncharacterized protein